MRATATGRGIRRTPVLRASGIAFAALVLTAAPALAWPEPTVPAGVAAAAASAPAAAPTSPSLASVTIALQLVAKGFSHPVYVTAAPDGSGRLFVVEQTGKIKIIKNGSVLATPFLTVANAKMMGTEQGLLGLAFHSHFATNHKLYVDYTNKDGTSVVREYRVSTGNPDVVDTSTSRIVLSQAQPYANHNGGMLAFGPDGALYIGFGDGGSAGDPGNRAQSLKTWLGKILRISVNGSTSAHNYLIPHSNPYVGKTGLDEIWAYGLRNPWRFSFDRATGNLWIGDVGQNNYEEVDRAVKTSNGAGRAFNWGWRVMEGSHCYSPPSGCNTSGKVVPLLDYTHASGRCSVTGGYVYRGAAIPALVGGYLFGDYCSGDIWVVDSAAPRPATPTHLLSTGFPISSFGQDQAGELYVVDYDGAIYRIVAG
jgi:glucose/arabinose dehydrogenase